MCVCVYVACVNERERKRFKSVYFICMYLRYITTLILLHPNIGIIRYMYCFTIDVTIKRVHSSVIHMYRNNIQPSMVLYQHHLSFFHSTNFLSINNYPSTNPPTMVQHGIVKDNLLHAHTHANRSVCIVYRNNNNTSLFLPYRI